MAHLEHICTRVTECISKRRWEDPIFERLSPNFQAFLEHSKKPYVSSGIEYVEAYKAITTANPDYRCEVLSVTVDLDEEVGEARVWMC